MIDTDYADDLVRFSNIPAQAESFLHSLKQPAGVIGLNVNANKTDFLSLNNKEPSLLLVASFWNQ